MEDGMDPAETAYATPVKSDEAVGDGEAGGETSAVHPEVDEGSAEVVGAEGTEGSDVINTEPGLTQGGVESDEESYMPSEPPQPPAEADAKDNVNMQKADSDLVEQPVEASEFGGPSESGGLEEETPRERDTSLPVIPGSPVVEASSPVGEEAAGGSDGGGGDGESAASVASVDGTTVTGDPEIRLPGRVEKANSVGVSSKFVKAKYRQQSMPDLANPRPAPGVVRRQSTNSSDVASGRPPVSTLEKRRTYSQSSQRSGMSTRPSVRKKPVSKGVQTEDGNTADGSELDMEIEQTLAKLEETVKQQQEELDRLHRAALADGSYVDPHIQRMISETDEDGATDMKVLTFDLLDNSYECLAEMTKLKLAAEELKVNYDAEPELHFLLDFYIEDRDKLPEMAPVMSRLQSRRGTSRRFSSAFSLASLDNEARLDRIESRYTFVVEEIRQRVVFLKKMMEASSGVVMSRPSTRGSEEIKEEIDGAGQVSLSVTEANRLLRSPDVDAPDGALKALAHSLGIENEEDFWIAHRFMDAKLPQAYSAHRLTNPVTGTAVTVYESKASGTFATTHPLEEMFTILVAILKRFRAALVSPEDRKARWLQDQRAFDCKTERSIPEHIRQSVSQQTHRRETAPAPEVEVQDEDDTRNGGSTDPAKVAGPSQETSAEEVADEVEEEEAPTATAPQEVVEKIVYVEKEVEIQRTTPRPCNTPQSLMPLYVTLEGSGKKHNPKNNKPLGLVWISPKTTLSQVRDMVHGLASVKKSLSFCFVHHDCIRRVPGGDEFTEKARDHLPVVLIRDTKKAKSKFIKDRENTKTIGLQVALDVTEPLKIFLEGADTETTLPLATVMVAKCSTLAEVRSSLKHQRHAFFGAAHDNNAPIHKVSRTMYSAENHSAPENYERLLDVQTVSAWRNIAADSFVFMASNGHVCVPASEEASAVGGLLPNLFVRTLGKAPAAKKNASLASLGSPKRQMGTIVSPGKDRRSPSPKRQIGGGDQPLYIVLRERGQDTTLGFVNISHITTLAKLRVIIANVMGMERVPDKYFFLQGDAPYTRKQESVTSAARFLPAISIMSAVNALTPPSSADTSVASNPGSSPLKLRKRKSKSPGKTDKLERQLNILVDTDPNPRGFMMISNKTTMANVRGYIEKYIEHRPVKFTFGVKGSPIKRELEGQLLAMETLPSVTLHAELFDANAMKKSLSVMKSLVDQSERPSTQLHEMNATKNWYAKRFTDVKTYHADSHKALAVNSPVLSPLKRTNTMFSTLIRREKVDSPKLSKSPDPRTEEMIRTAPGRAGDTLLQELGGGDADSGMRTAMRTLLGNLREMAQIEEAQEGEKIMAEVEQEDQGALQDGRSDASGGGSCEEEVNDEVPAMKGPDASKKSSSGMFEAKDEATNSAIQAMMGNFNGLSSKNAEREGMTAMEKFQSESPGMAAKVVSAGGSVATIIQTRIAEETQAAIPRINQHQELYDNRKEVEKSESLEAEILFESMMHSTIRKSSRSPSKEESPQDDPSEINDAPNQTEGDETTNGLTAPDAGPAAPTD